VYKGASNTVRAGFLSDFHLALPRGMRDHLKASVVSMQPLLAPISAGQSVGTMRLTLDGRPLREVPVVALDEVPVAGVLGRGWDTLRLLFH
jgi:D-alanyl-D-alanine carboxypeptidase